MITALIAWIMMKLDILEEEVYYEAEVANAASLFTRKTFLIIEVILIYFIMILGKWSLPVRKRIIIIPLIPATNLTNALI